MQTQETLLEGKFLSFVKNDSGWEYIIRPGVSGVVVIIPVTNNNELVLIEQLRPPVGCRVMEFPAGLAGDIPGQENEPMESAARRELLEETGYEAEYMELVCEGPPSAGQSSEYVHIFKATGLKKVGEGGGDDSEDITVHVVPAANVEQFLKDKMAEGLMVDPKVFAGLYFI
ncbi:MAG: NUDIX hydrolase [Lentisphaeria bacterium]|nr:NUDIX hydrolase [Lentisphaeria bacterium]NQZ68960.1 NUDIX hydrolase [Lentisphaeria bacterium]